MKDNQKIIDDVKLKMAISNFQKEETKEMPKYRNIFKSVAVACCMIFSISGMVFAKEISTKIYDNFFLTGKGMETAMNEGYIENTTMDYQTSNATIENEETGEIIEDAETQLKVDEFVMDDFNLSMTFDVTLSEKAQEIITSDEVMEMNFPDLVIYDENDVVLFCLLGSDAFNEFCKEHNLNYDFDTVPDDKLMNTGVNNFVLEKNENHIKVIYNIYTDGSVFPKSKKLNIEMNQIKISKKETTWGDEEITLKGDWKFDVDVPEKMYNRTTTAYIQKSTTNPDFNVTSAVLYDTGMDVSLKFKAEKLPEEPTTPEIEFFKSLPQDDKLRTCDIFNYLENQIKYTPEYNEYSNKSFSVWEYDKYLTNENGEKFEMTQGPKANGGGTIDDDGIYTSNCTFDLTKYDATDCITVHVDYHGNTAEIVLEKVEEK